MTLDFSGLLWDESGIDPKFGFEEWIDPFHIQQSERMSEPEGDLT
jgi:hypothetical protein